MGLRGPAPKPGSQRALRVLDSPVVAEGSGGAPEPPAQLPAHLRDAWDRIAEPMRAAGLLVPADAVAIEAAARCLARWQEAEAVIEREGIIIEGAKGRVAHPAVRIARDAAAEYRSWSARLGLTPADRIGIGMAQVRGQSLATSIEARIGANPRSAG